MGILDGDIGLEITKRRRRLPPDTVVYKRVRCPKCRSFNCPVQNTKPPAENVIIRYHKCQDCEFTFKSVEQI